MLIYGRNKINEAANTGNIFFRFTNRLRFSFMSKIKVDIKIVIIGNDGLVISIKCKCDCNCQENLIFNSSGFVIGICE